jgi:hypothetical protein
MLGVLVALTALAGFIESLSRRRKKRALRRLAGEWGMTYSARDRLRITSKVAGGLPVPGAADVYVLDVIYGAVNGHHRYVFTVEYTSGTVRGKRRHVRVAAFSEPRDGRGPDAATPIVMGPEGVSLVEQYRRLAPAAQ